MHQARRRRSKDRSARGNGTDHKRNPGTRLARARDGSAVRRRPGGGGRPRTPGPWRDWSSAVQVCRWTKARTKLSAMGCAFGRPGLLPGSRAVNRFPVRTRCSGGRAGAVEGRVARVNPNASFRGALRNPGTCFPGRTDALADSAAGVQSATLLVVTVELDGGASVVGGPSVRRERRHGRIRACPCTGYRARGSSRTRNRAGDSGESCRRGARLRR